MNMRKTQQKPLGSFWNEKSTADDVLKNRDLTGKHILITGGHSGLGLETTRALVDAGAEVTIAARNIEEAKEAIHSLPRTKVEGLDLAQLDQGSNSVAHLAGRLLDQGKHIDILINNAGVMACSETRIGQAWEAQFAINHLGHFVLTNRLWPLLKGGARVVTLTSVAHQRSAIRWDDINFRYGYNKWLAYAQSKTANSLFSVYLDTLGQKDNVRAFAVHPGNISTPLQRHLSHEDMLSMGWMDKDGNPTVKNLKTIPQGAATTVWAAIADELDSIGGVYCENCDIAFLETSIETTLKGVKPYAVDKEQAQRLWTLSAELTGVNAF